MHSVLCTVLFANAKVKISKEYIMLDVEYLSLASGLPFTVKQVNNSS